MELQEMMPAVMGDKVVWQLCAKCVEQFLTEKSH